MGPWGPMVAHGAHGDPWGPWAHGAHGTHGNYGGPWGPMGTHGAHGTHDCGLRATMKSARFDAEAANFTSICWHIYNWHHVTAKYENGVTWPMSNICQAFQICVRVLSYNGHIWCNILLHICILHFYKHDFHNLCIWTQVCNIETIIISNSSNYRTNKHYK